jgi:hypothetical protein
MLISETEYKHQVEEDIKPFRDVLLGLFFITIGMLLNVKLVMANWWLVLLLLCAPVLLKFALIAGLAKLFGASDGVSMRTGLALAQAGEFGFVLLNLAAAQPDGFRGAGGAGVDGAVDAAGAVHHRAVRQDRDEVLQQRVDDAVAAADQDRQPHHVHQQARDRVRLRPQRPEPGHPAGRRKIDYHALDLDPSGCRKRRRRRAGVLRRCGAARKPGGGRYLPRQRVVITYADTPRRCACCTRCTS